MLLSWFSLSLRRNEQGYMVIVVALAEFRKNEIKE